MWRDFLGWVRLLWNTGSQTEKNTNDITALAESDARQLSSIEKLQSQREHDREMNERRIESLEKEIASLRRELQMAQENTELKLRLALSEHLRQLPPPGRPDDEPKP